MAGIAAGLLVTPVAAGAASSGLVIWVPATEVPTGTLIPANGIDVPVTLDISPAGDLRCSSAPNAAPPELRRASCLIVAGRSIFAPRVDRNGKAIDTSIGLVLRWLPLDRELSYGGALPISPDQWITIRDLPIPQMLDGTTTVSFTITDMGRVRDCTVTGTSRHLVLDGAVCPLLVKRALFFPAVGADGVRRATTGRYAHRWPG